MAANSKMARQAAVSYFYQSGFTVAIGKTLLIFSYFEAEEEQLPESYRLSDRDFKGFNNIVVFVPSAALEHHDPVIYTWKKAYPITYVVYAEAAKDAPQGANLRAIREGESLSVAGVQVRAFGSTDRGISFLVNCLGISIFHAGDLNLWHWREESTLREITRAEEAYYEAVSRIPKERLDICMFPLDPNQGGFYDAGANHFIMALRPQVFFPMHFAMRREIAQDYARRMHTAHTQVSALTRPRETAIIDFTTKPPMLRGLPSQRSPFGDAPGDQPRNIDLNAYISDDPFAETDLPVDLSRPQ